jgi:hypothetical protein
VDAHRLGVHSDAVNDLALHFLAKMKILVIRDIERDQIEFVSKVRHPSVSNYVVFCFPFPSRARLTSPVNAEPGLQAGGQRG